MTNVHAGRLAVVLLISAVVELKLAGGAAWGALQGVHITWAPIFGGWKSRCLARALNVTDERESSATPAGWC